MPQYSLSEYTTKIAALIQDGQIEEAIAHARHILSHYPRYLPAYSLLAHASVEKGDLSRASHFFQSVLSANPEDADAWMNLAQLSDDLGEVEQAAWHMERAFEIEPGNSRIHEELRQLYSRRDGVERSRIKLTPAALARTQARSGSFRRASQKLQRLLNTAGNVPPLQIATLEVALAQALWNQEGKSSLADEVCGSLLQKLPECLQANLIRAQIYSSGGQSQDAEPYLNAARGLDPEGEFAFKMLGPQSPLPLTRVEIPYLDYQPARAEPQPVAPAEPEDTNWLDEIGQSVDVLAQQGQAQESGIESEPDQETQEATAPAIEDTERKIEPAVPAQPALAAEAEPSIPAWLRQIQQEGIEDTDQDEDLDWLQEPEEEEEAAQTQRDTAPLRPRRSEGPDWLEGLRPIHDEPEEPEPGPLPSEQRTLVGEVPDWLLDLGQEAEMDDMEPSEAVSPQQVVGESEPGPTDLGLSDDRERPAWLQELRAEIQGTPAAAPALQPTDEAKPAPELPEELVPSTVQEISPEPYEWLSDLGVTDLPAEQDLEEIPELFVEEAEAEPALEPTPEGELPEWLLELRDQTSAETPTEPMPEPAETETTRDTKPLERPEREPVASLISEADLELEEQEPEYELPEWLQELEITAESEAATEPADALETEEAPDWLAEPDQEPLPTVTVDEMPDWLSRLRETEDETAREPGLAAPEAEPAREPSLAALEPEPATGIEDLEWLQELEAAPVEEFAPAPLPETPVEPKEPVAIGAPPAPELGVEPARAEEPSMPTVGAPLVRARSLLSEGTLDAATQQYESLLARGDVEEALIVELEEAVQAHPEHSGLQRVLGDAYVRSNQLAQALDAYREALRKL